jgi:hypothetical protein
MASTTPDATSPAARTRPAHRRTRPRGPSVGQATTSAVSSAIPVAVAPALTRTPPVGARTQGQHQQSWTGHYGDRDRDERGAPAGERGLGRGWSPEQVARASQCGDDPGGDAEGRVADIERVEQRARGGRGGAYGEPADHRADGGHADNGPPRAPGARNRECGPGRVERQHQRGGPQPARWRVIARVGGAGPFARLDDRDGSQQPGERVLLVVHAGLSVAEPRALHPLRAGVRGILVVGLRAHSQSRDAGGTFGDRLSQVGEPGLPPAPPATSR